MNNCRPHMVQTKGLRFAAILTLTQPIPERPLGPTERNKGMSTVKLVGTDQALIDLQRRA